MKLAIVFEVPDEQADAYDDVAARMVLHHTFAKQEKLRHWSFDLEMRPIAAGLVPYAHGDLHAALEAATDTIDQEHPWVPGGVFKMHEGLKPLMLWVLRLLA